VWTSPGTGGALATVDDYKTVFDLVKDVYEASLSGGASPRVRAVVEAVGEGVATGGREHSRSTGVRHPDM
jgi:hypothetical protein